MKRSKPAVLVQTNPVARALAFVELKRLATTYQARIFCMDRGEQDKQFLINLSRYFGIVLVACGFDRIEQRVDANYKELISYIKVGLDHLVAMSRNQYRWDYDRAMDLNDALEASLLIVPKLTPVAVDYARKATEHVE